MTTVSTHAPGDRVRIQHDPARDAGYSPIGIAARRKLNGAEGVIRERAIPAMFRVEARGDDAWFAHDELSPIVTDPDGLEVGAPPARSTPREVAARAGAALAAGLADRTVALPSPQDDLASLAAVVAERDALRAACEAAVGSTELSTPDLAAWVRGCVARSTAEAKEARGEAAILRAACEAVTGTAGLPAPVLVARVLAGSNRTGAPGAKARARLHEGDPAAAKP